MAKKSQFRQVQPITPEIRANVIHKFQRERTHHQGRNHLTSTVSIVAHGLLESVLDACSDVDEFEEMCRAIEWCFAEARQGSRA